MGNLSAWSRRAVARVWRCGAAAALSLAVAPVVDGAEPYEPAGPVPAAEYLPPELMRGEEWTVAPEAANDGLDNTYTVDSRFGSWEPRGAPQLMIRIREIGALARLEEASKTKVFLDAVENAITAPVRLVKDAAEKPKETLLAIPRGVSRWFRRTTFQVRETYHDVSEEVKEERAERRARKEAEDQPASEEEAAAAAEAAEEKRRERADQAKRTARKQALDYLRITGAERRWYRELEVDPYTDNELLREAVTSVARVDGLTGFGVKTLVGLPSIPGFGALRTTMDLVWSTHPAELRLQNRKRMRAAGLSEETARSFEDGEMTLTEQTWFLRSLDDLAGVEGREHLFASAVELESREEARSLAIAVAMLAEVHVREEPLAAVIGGSALPVARTEAGGLVSVAPAGAVFHTEEVAAGFREFSAIHAGRAAEPRRMYFAGRTSERFEAAVGRLGWSVVEGWRVVLPNAPQPGTGHPPGPDAASDAQPEAASAGGASANP